MALPDSATAPSGRGERSAAKPKTDRPVSVEAWAVGFGLALLLLSFPWIAANNGLIALAISTGINVIALYGLALLFGQVGILSVGHAALMGVGAYAAAILARDFGLGLWAVLPICAVLTAMAAGLLGFPALRVSGHHFVILTFAFGELLTIVLTNGGSFTGRATGLDVGLVPTPFGIDVNSLKGMYYLVLIFVVASMAAVYLIVRSSYGRSLRAIRENAQLAESIGIDVRRRKIEVFMISGLFAGVAGALMTYYLRHISPSLFGSFPSVFLALMVMMGGARLLIGPLGGAIIITFLPEVLSLDPVQARIVYGAALIGVIMMLPDGAIAGIRDGFKWSLSQIMAVGGRRRGRADS